MKRRMKVPEPIVKKPRLLKYAGMNPGTRRGKGFSIGELQEAGISVDEARRLGIPVDKRRRSAHEWNVEALRRYLGSLKGRRNTGSEARSS